VSSTARDSTFVEENPLASKTIDALTAYNEVIQTAEEIRCDAHEKIDVMSPGDVIRQGDIYVTCLESEPPGGRPVESRRLAQGTTQGASHYVVGDCDVLQVPPDEAAKALRHVVPGANQQQFVGPVIRAHGPVMIAHPEHGNRTLPGNTCYLVTYQRVWQEERVRLQLD
jgi:hypothetical protein